jgi:pimeloyl-ACP methyl ester carboxylesterase
VSAPTTPASQASPSDPARPLWPEPEEAAADGRRIAVRRIGTTRPGSPGVPALLLHGLGETSATWREAVAHFPPGMTALAADLPGFGASEARGSCALSAVAASMAAMVLEEIDGPVDVVGHGWGATLAIALAASRPALVRRLVVIDGGWPPWLPAGPSQPAPGMSRSRLLAECGGPAGFSGLRRAYLDSDPHLEGIPRPERSRVIWGARAPGPTSLRPRYGEKVVSALGRCVDPATVDMITIPGVGSAPHRAAAALVAALLCEFLLAS